MGKKFKSVVTIVSIVFGLVHQLGNAVEAIIKIVN